MARRITLRSPLDPVALAKRLQQRVPAKVDDKTVAQVIGRGSEQEMALWYYRPRFRNDLATRLTATIEPDGTGSVIEGRIGAPMFGLVFMGCWLAFVLIFIFAGIGITAIVHTPSPFLIIPLAMLAFGVAFGWLALRHGKHDADAIRAFLAETVEAR